jgi:hypothetical protein
MGFNGPSAVVINVKLNHLLLIVIGSIKKSSFQVIYDILEIAAELTILDLKVAVAVRNLS